MSSDDGASSDHDDPDPRFVSARARSLPSWPIRGSVTLGPDRPPCLLALVSCNHAATLAALASDLSVRLHDPSTLQAVGAIGQHSDHVRALRPLPDSSALVTASEDGSWKLVDVRTGTVQIAVETGRPLLSFDCNGVLAAAGLDLQGDTAIWDIRNCSSALGVLDQFHTDEVRDVRFHPVYRSILLTGSVDGLINKFDLNAPCLDDALIAVFNTNQAVRSFQVFGPAAEYVYAISEIETLSLCDLSTDDVLCSVDDVCGRLSADLSVRYLVDCQYDADRGALTIFAGNYHGDLVGARVGPPARLDPTLTLFHGHSSGVRALTSIDRVLFTAGEDACITSWTPPNI